MIYIIHRFYLRWPLKDLETFAAACPAFKMGISNLYARGIRVDQGNSGKVVKNNDGLLLKPVEEKLFPGTAINH